LRRVRPRRRRRGRAHADGLDLVEPRHVLRHRRVPRRGHRRHRPDQGRGDRRVRARRRAVVGRVLHDGVDREGDRVRADRGVPPAAPAGHLRRALPEPGMNIRSILSSRWAVLGGFALGAILLMGVAPAVLSDFRLGLLGKYLCFAMVAVGIGLAWGRGGMLVLGQGVFFGLGAYLMAMHLKLADAPASTGVPDFMALISSDGVPWWWEPFRSGAVTLIAIVVIPAVVAIVLGLA